MKKKNWKIVGLAFSCAMAFSVGGVIAMQTASAEPYDPSGADFQMLKGASVRTEENPGIRFTAYLSEEYVASLGEGYEMGMAIIPKSVADKIEGFDEKEMDAFIGEDRVQLRSVTQFVPEQLQGKYARAGYKMFRVSLVQIPETEEFWETEIIANAYVKVGDEYTFVSDFTDDNTEDKYENEAQQRDIAHVAAIAKANGETGTIIEDIIEVVSASETLNVDAETTNAGNVILGIGEEKTTTISGSTTSDYAVCWETANQEIATVDATGKITGVKAGETTVTASFGVQDPVTYTVHVFNEAYDFEDGQSHGYLLRKPDTAAGSCGLIGSTNVTNFPADGYGNYAYRSLMGNTKTQYVELSMDYLEYGFSNPSVAYFTMDWYMPTDGGSTDMAIRYKTSTKDIIKGATLSFNTTYRFSISRWEYEIMKECGDTSFQFYFYNGTTITDKQLYIDNLRFVTYDDMHAQNNTYGLDDGVNSRIVHALDGSTELGVTATGAGACATSLTSNAFAFKLTGDYKNFGISADYLYWVFEVKNATSLSFDVSVSALKSGTAGIETYSYHLADKKTWARDKSDDDTYVAAGGWGTLTITKEDYVAMRDAIQEAKNNNAAASLNTCNLCSTCTRGDHGMGLRFRVNNVANGYYAYFDNFTLNF